MQKQGLTITDVDAQCARRQEATGDLHLGEFGHSSECWKCQERLRCITKVLDICKQPCVIKFALQKWKEIERKQNV